MGAIFPDDGHPCANCGQSTPAGEAECSLCRRLGWRSLIRVGKAMAAASGPEERADILRKFHLAKGRSWLRDDPRLRRHRVHGIREQAMMDEAARARQRQYNADQRVLEWQHRTERQNDNRRSDRYCDDMGVSTSPGWENGIRIIEDGVQ